MVSLPLTDHLPTWRESPRGHPNRLFVDYALNGIQHGFRVEFDQTSSLRLAQRHMLSATTRADIVAEYMRGEQEQGRILEPVPIPSASPGTSLQFNRIGVVPVVALGVKEGYGLVPVTSLGPYGGRKFYDYKKGHLSGALWRKEVL